MDHHAAQQEIAALLTAALAKVRAALYARLRDFDIVQDAVQDAALSAWQRWPEQGTPASPEAWLLTVARNRALDLLRHRQVVDRHGTDSQQSGLRVGAHPGSADSSLGCDDAIDDLGQHAGAAFFNDHLLRLVFTCCHPSLPRADQVLLTLRVVTGMAQGELARAFLIGERAVEQRLTRAKRRIRAAEIAWHVPRDGELAARIEGVSAVAYLIFNEGYAATAGDALLRSDLCDEAIRLTRQLLRLMPRRAELQALLALMLLHHARAAARCDEHGRLRLLAEQNRRLWNRRQINEGLAWLDLAFAQRQRPGPYQVQAAIAALHAQAPTSQQTDWPQIRLLYEKLIELHDTPVVRLNHAVAVAMCDGPLAGLDLLAPLATPLTQYHLYFSSRAALHAQCGHVTQANLDYRRALTLAGNGAERLFLVARGSKGASLVS